MQSDCVVHTCGKRGHRVIHIKHRSVLDFIINIIKLQWPQHHQRVEEEKKKKKRALHFPFKVQFVCGFREAKKKPKRIRLMMFDSMRV